jgi:hypothetical protein
MSIDAMSDFTGFDSVDEDLFREELEAAAPHLLDQFDSIRRKHEHQLEEAGCQYNEIKADLDDLANEQAIIISNLSQSQERLGDTSVSESSDSIRRKYEQQLEEAGRQYDELKADLDDLANEKAIIISNLSQSQGDFGDASVSGSSDRTRSTDSNSVSSPADQQPQATTQAKTRVALSTSTDSNPASPKTNQLPQATTQAKKRVALSTSTTSSPASPQFDQPPQATTQAKTRVALSTSTDSNPASPQFNQPPQATTQAKTRTALSTSTDSNPVSPQYKQRPQATTQAKKRVALSTSSDSNPSSPPPSQHPQATTRAKKRVALSTSSDSNPSSPPAVQQPQATTQAKTRVALSTSSDSNPSSPPAGQQPQATTQAKTRVALSTSTDSSPSSLPGSPPPFKQQTETSTHTKSSALLSTLTETSTDGSATSSAGARKVSSSQAVLTMQIQIRLIPVIKLLTAAVTTPSTRARALEQAHAAFQYAKDRNASPPLLARCSFYIAHATYDSKDSRTTQEAVTWFQRAVEADEADYPEGQWAQQWLNRYESINLDSRPSTGSSWLANISNNMWNAVFRSNGTSEDPGPQPALKPRPGLLWRLYSNENTRPAKAGFGRVPSFTTWNSGEIAPQAGEGSSQAGETPLQAGETPSPSSVKEASPIAPTSAKEAGPTAPSSAKEISPTILSYAKYPSPTFFGYAKEPSPGTPSNATRSGTQDFYGLKWSPGHPFGKGKVLHGRDFELVFSPDMISPIQAIPEEEHEHGEGEQLQGEGEQLQGEGEQLQREEEQPQHIPANVHGGLTDAPRREPSFRTKRMWGRPEGSPSWQTILENLDFYVPPEHGRGKLRIMNQWVDYPSKSSPDSLDFHLQPVEHLRVVNRTSTPSTSGPSSPRTLQSSISAISSAPSSIPPPLPSPPSTNRQHSRSQSVSVPNTHVPTSPLSTAPVKTYAASEGGSSSEILSARNKKRGSFSHAIIRATGLDVPRAKDEAARMEEGESPTFGPRKEEVITGLYRRWKGGEGSGDGGGDEAMERVRVGWTEEVAEE